MYSSLRQVALFVPDLRAAERYYQSVFDMELIGREADGRFYFLEANSEQPGISQTVGSSFDRRCGNYYAVGPSAFCRPTRHAADSGYAPRNPAFGYRQVAGNASESFFTRPRG